MAYSEKMSANILLCFIYFFTCCCPSSISKDSAAAEIQNILDNANVTIWSVLKDIPEIECDSRWTCQNYNYSKLSMSMRGHYRDKNCACDDLCVLFKDCCPDVQLQTTLKAGSSADGNGLTGGDFGASGSGKSASDGEHLGGAEMNDETLLTPHPQFEENESSVLSQSETSLNKFPASDDNEYHDSGIYRRYDLTADMFSCILDKGINADNNVSLVNRCPQVYQGLEVANLCHHATEDDMMTMLPVSGTTSKVLYRNMYCAICHQESFLYWAAGINCLSSEPLPYTTSSRLSDIPLNSSHCSRAFQPPSASYQWRPCRAGVERHCSQSFTLDTPINKLIAAKCEEAEDSIQRAVFISRGTAGYRNLYCALCNHISITSVTCELPFIDIVKATRLHFPYSFSILMDINTNTDSTALRLRQATFERIESAALSCGMGHVFDPFRSICRPVTCGPGRNFSGNACVVIDRQEESLKSQADNGNTSSSSSRSDNGTEATNCTLIQLNVTEYKLFRNGSLELLDSNSALYDASQYVIQNDGVFLCVNYSRNYRPTDKKAILIFNFSVTEAIVSTCGICVSLIALAITIAVYASLRQLRNIPGQNLLSLMCSLFVADLLLLVAPSASELFPACAVIAGVMHYFFLASFAWMNVMAVDVWFTFSKAFVKAGDRGKSSKRFLMFSIYAWLLPVVFVLPAVLLQILNPDYFLNPRYGVGICWLSNKFALFLFFAAPLFVLLVLNIVFFLISAVNISQAKKRSARMLGKDEESKMAIYVKLTVVLGITWITGFLAALVPENQILTYCFVVLNTLQGFFICLSFVFTNKVLRLLRGKFSDFKKNGGKKSKSTDMTVSTPLTARRITSESPKLLRNVNLYL